MKIRSDFVSNSSSSSFVFDSNQPGLKEFFIEFKKLFAKLHNITCIFTTHKDLMMSSLKAFLNYKEVQIWTKIHQVPIEYDEERGTIDFYPQMLLNDTLFDICWRVIMKPCDEIEIRIADSWGDYNFAMHQILTLLEYKGFNFTEAYSEEGWVKMNLKDNDNENQK